HALGDGLVIAEIQQASNTTFRLFDWNRVGKDGQPRPLHVQQSLEVTDYDRGPVGPQQPDVVGPGVERLVACDKFVLDRRCLSGDDQPVGSDGQTVGGDDRFHILSAVAGGATLTCGDHETPLPLGATVLLPAAAGQAVLSAQTEQATGAAVLDMYLP
ncbi:MAG: class I mannose-6-phosphate isomerase, partial [Planctomycetota bacterium]